MITCQFENGNKASLRHATVGVIALNESGEVLLTRRAARLTRPGSYTIPGGFLDRGETASEGALRELKEETGYSGEIVLLFHVNDSPTRPNEDRENVDFTFIVKIVGGEATENSEVSEIGWFSLENLPSEDEFAFDHRKTIMKYFDFLQNAFMTPLLGEIT